MGTTSLQSDGIDLCENDAAVELLFAAVCDEGSGYIFHGVGTTESAALADARRGLESGTEEVEFVADDFEIIQVPRSQWPMVKWCGSAAAFMTEASR